MNNSDFEKLKTEIAYISCGGGYINEQWDEALDRAEEIILLVLSHKESSQQALKPSEVLMKPASPAR